MLIKKQRLVPLALLALVFIAFLLAARGAHAQGLFGMLRGGPKEPILLEDSTEWKAAAADAFGKRPDDGKVRKLAISAFRINFITDTTKGQTIGKSDASMSYQLEVLPATVYQAITDRTRDAFVAALKERGIEVLPQDALLADADFAARAAEAAKPQVREANVLRNTGSIVVNASGTADNWGVMGKVHEMKLAEKAGDGVGLVGVNVFLTFATLEQMGWFERATSRTTEGERVGAGVKGALGLSLASDENGNGGASEISLSVPTGNYPMKMHRVLGLKQPFAKSTENATTGADVAAGVLGALLGRNSATSRTLVKPADDYEQQVSAGLAQAMRVFAEQLAPR